MSDELATSAPVGLTKAISPAVRELLAELMRDHADAIIDVCTDWVIAHAKDLRGARPRGETRALAERNLAAHHDLIMLGDGRAMEEFIEHTTSYRAPSQFHVSTLLRGFLGFKRGVEAVMEGMDIDPWLRLDTHRTLERLYHELAFRLADLYAEKLLGVIRQTQEQLVQREKLAALGGLVAGVAHEINTPMGVAVTAASLVRDRITTLEDAYARNELRRSSLTEFFASARPAVDITLSNLRRASELIVSFRQVSVEQSNTIARRIRLSTYLRDVLSSLTPLYRRSGHSLSVEFDDSIVVTTHAGALSQIVTNLLQNALTHAFEPGRAGTISLGLRREGEEIELTVADDGRGMSDEERGRIFEPFFTTRRGAGGSGLGMHIVHNLVTELLGGTIVVDSTLGEGTRVIVRFPAGE